jgi:tRNA G37 N-methylase TrmD
MRSVVSSRAFLGEEKSLTHESFTNKLLDFPQYTRPAEFRGMSVPEVLLSGNHAEIEKWRQARQVWKKPVRSDPIYSNKLKPLMNPIIQEITAAQVKKDRPPFQCRRRCARAHQGPRRRQRARAESLRAS